MRVEREETYYTPVQGLIICHTIVSVTIWSTGQTRKMNDGGDAVNDEDLFYQNTYLSTTKYNYDSN